MYELLGVCMCVNSDATGSGNISASASSYTINTTDSEIGKE